MRWLWAMSLAFVAFCTAPAIADTSEVTAPSEWRLVWSDEFDGDAIDTSKWRLKTREDHTLGATFFSDDPRHVRVENGVLKLIARRGPLGRYTSGMVETQHITSWQYGRFEARIKVPRGKGTNAAFWMMHRTPTIEKWPLGGEIDIVEQLGRQPHRAYSAIHFKGEENVPHGGRYESPTPLYENFHVYAVEWTETGFALFVDGNKYADVRDIPQSRPDRPLYPYDRAYFIMLSNVIGGKWPGMPGLFATWPKTMEIDWVRVYQRPGDRMVRGEEPRDPTTR